MTTTAKLGMTLWEAGSGNPSPAHNDALSRLDFFASNTVISRSTDAQPVSPTEGDAYIITGSATGDDWGASPFTEGDIAVYETIDGITGWYRYAPVEGFPMVVQDESAIVAYIGAVYVTVGGDGLTNPMTTAGDIIKGGASGDPERLAIGAESMVLEVVSGAPAWGVAKQKRATIVTISDATDDLEASWDGDYIRMTNTGDKVLNVRADATHALPTAGQWHIRAAGATGNLTITPAGGVTINAPAGGTLVLEPGMTATLFRTGTDAFDLIGQTVAA